MSILRVCTEPELSIKGGRIGCYGYDYVLALPSRRYQNDVWGRERYLPTSNTK